MIKKDTVIPTALRLLIFSVLSYGLVYFSYKYFVPMQGGGGGDFFTYAYMYQNPLVFSSSQVSSPFVYRQLSAIITHIIYLLAKSGLYLDPPGFGILFRSQDISQIVYFAGIVSNYIALVLCAWGVSLAIDEFDQELPEIYSLSGGILCFLSVHSQQHILTGLTEGWSWVLIAFGFLFYLRRSRIGLSIILSLSVIQREIILVIFGIFAFVTIFLDVKDMDRIQWDEIRFELYVFTLSVVGFSIYILMRTVLIPVPGAESQLTASVLLTNLLSPDITLKLLLSTFYVQNILFLYIFGGLWLFINYGSFNVDRHFFYHIIFSFIGILIIGLAAGIGNNIGRISGLLTPLSATLVPPLFYSLREKSDHDVT